MSAEVTALRRDIADLRSVVSELRTEHRKEAGKRHRSSIATAAAIATVITALSQAIYAARGVPPLVQPATHEVKP